METLICEDCKAVNTFRTGKRGSAFVEWFLWATLFFPGIFYTIWRGRKEKRICRYCGSDFLLPPELSSTSNLNKK